MKSLIASSLWSLLFLCAVGVVYFSGYQRGKNDAVTVCQRQRLQDSETLLSEMRWLVGAYSDSLRKLAQLQQQRQAEGEERREQIKTAMQGDECARRAPPSGVSDRLLRRKTPGADQSHSPDSAGKPDHGNTGTGAG